MWFVIMIVIMIQIMIEIFVCLGIQIIITNMDMDMDMDMHMDMHIDLDILFMDVWDGREKRFWGSYENFGNLFMNRKEIWELFSASRPGLSHIVKVRWEIWQ